VQEVLADRKDLTPRVFDDLREALGAEWSGCLSQRPDPRGIRVGWLSRGQLSNPTDVAVYPQRVPATTIDDDGNEITAITAAKRGGAGSHLRPRRRADGARPHRPPEVQAADLPRPRPPASRFDTHDEGERARFGLYALNQRAAEAATVRAWATDQLQGHGQQRHVLVCGYLNDTPQAATTQLLLGPPGSQLGTGGFTNRIGATATGCGTWRPRCPRGTQRPAKGRPTGRGSTTASRS
jgi:hypothetical protein